MNRTGSASHPGRVRRCGLAAAALASLVAAGCGRAPTFVEVEGTVTLNGTPLPEVEVVFLPDSDKGNRGPRAAAYTDGQGRYRLFCDQADQIGTVAGPTRICIIDITAVAPLDAPGGGRPPDTLLVRPGERPGKAENKRSRVPPAYGSVAQTPLRVEVVPGRTVLDLDIPSGTRP